MGTQGLKREGNELSETLFRKLKLMVDYRQFAVSQHSNRFSSRQETQGGQQFHKKKKNEFKTLKRLPSCIQETCRGGVRHWV